MIGLVLKKATFEIWDQGLSIFALNLAFGFVLLCLGIAVEPLFETALGAGVAIALILATALTMQTLGVAWLLHIRRREPFRMLAMLRSSLSSIMLALPAVFGLLTLIVWLPGLALVWIVPILMAILIFLPALLSLGHGVDSLKGLALLLFDNPLYCLAILSFAAMSLMLTLGLLPGPIGITLLGAHAAELRLKRYVPERTDDRRPDWDVILADERQRLDRRSFRSLWQPWKA